ncbi:neuroligin-4, X-linked [Culicoides brevitarsis]|uniref:neuroligin-4, X-linked n=1 Tax=Culicoides brevitarsis TaxID=469753 RepID=UPI00307BA08A
MEMLIHTLIISLLLPLVVLPTAIVGGGGASGESSSNANKITNNINSGGSNTASNNNKNNNINNNNNNGQTQNDGVPLSSRIVNTKYGAVSGTILHLENRHLDAVEAFRGIPYASPPVGSLRFMPPVTGALWSGIKKADQFGPVCPQRFPDISNETAALERMPKGRLEYLRRLLPYLQNQSEDCLYLNIYGPVQAGSRDGNHPKYAVMVFVHGESYEWMSGNPYDGSVLASYGQILVVTINYRLGILGFLNANVDRYSKAPANYGLMDIIAALHWIQENIEAFGGDPRAVTLAGYGTGAACVHYLMTSSAVPDGLLFHRAMLMSGSGLAPASLVGEPAKYAAFVSHHVNCSATLPYAQLMKCLREKPLAALLSAPVPRPPFGQAFGPSVDGVVIDVDEVSPTETDYGVPNLVIKKTPRPFNTLNTINSILLRKSAINKLSKYDLMVGVTRAESYLVFNSDDVQYGIEPDRRSKILRSFVKNTYSYHLNEILATIINEYTDWERPVQHPINIRDETVEALSDAQIVAPATHTIDLHAVDRRHSYFYVFEYQSKYGDFPQRQGCVHGDDLPYIFGAPLVGGFNHFPRNYTKSEVALSEVVMAYWSNFVRTGNPSDQGTPDSQQHQKRVKTFEWVPYESVHKKYLNLDIKPKIKNHYRAHRLSFWLNLVPDLHKPGGDDVPNSHHSLEADEDLMLSSTVKPLNPPLNSSVQTIGSIFPFLNISYGGNASSRATVQQKQIPAAGDVDMNDEFGQQSGTNAPQEDGFAAYSTALSVTIAIGCSLLILNVLIFAGVYYQRDKTRLTEPFHGPKKRPENGQMPNNICGDLESLTIHAKNDPSTILAHHAHAMQHHQHQPPPEFADIRAPPPPKHIKSGSGNGGDASMMSQQHTLTLIGGNCGTLTKKNCSKSNLNASHQHQHQHQQQTSNAMMMDELRV